MSHPSPKSTTSPPIIDPKKHDALYKLYLIAFESFRINAKKKDSKFQEIKDLSQQLKNATTSFATFDQIRSVSLIFSHPIETPSNKTIEIILITLDSIITNELLDASTLLEVCQGFLIYYLTTFLKTMTMSSDDNIYCKAFNTCLLIYKSKQLTSHYEILSNIIKISVGIYYSGKHPQSQLAAKNTLTLIIDHMIEQLENIYNQSYTNRNSIQKHSITSNKDEFISMSISPLVMNDKEQDAKVISSIMTNYMLDLIELSISKPNIIKNYIAVLNQYDDKSYEDLKSKLEEMKLDDSNKILKNEKGFHAGKYGWCIICHNSASNFNDKARFPLCKNNECEHDLLKKLNLFESNLPRSDFIIMFNALSKISIKEPASNSGEESTQSKHKMFCLEFLKIMIEKGEKYFSTDDDVIKIIKDLLMDSLVKNTLSSEINILKLSIDIFFSLIRNYRKYLKDQIEIFINRVLIVILESENLGFAYKEVILNALIDFSDNPAFLVEIYINYDCDIKYKPVYYELINLLTKIINGLYRKSKYSNIYKQIGDNNLREKCFEFFNRFILNLSMIVESNHNKSDYNPNNTGMTNCNNNEIQNESIYPDGGGGEYGMTSPLSLNLNEVSTLGMEIKDKINQNIKYKALLQSAMSKFNVSPSSCLNYLKSHELIVNEQSFQIQKEKFLLTKEKSNQAQNNSNSNNKNDDEALPDISNIMQSPFNFNVNPVYIFLSPLDYETMTKITYEDFTAYQMAWFIRSNIKLLHQETTGKYLCSGNKFNIKVVTYFIDSFQFKGIHILAALRLLFSELYIIGEGQIIDRIVQIFGNKYHKENPTKLRNPDHSYYIAFSIIILNTDLHRDEVANKMTPSLYIKQVRDLCKSDEIDEKYLSDIFNQISSNPLVIPGQRVNINKSKKEILKIERESIYKKTLEDLKSISLISDYYITEIDNENIRHLLNDTWSYFFSIFSQLLSDLEDEKLISSCIQNILLMGKTCGILHLDTIAEAFINTIINRTNLLEGKEITLKNHLCITQLINFIMNNGKYIRTCWYNILMAISKIDYYQSVQSKSYSESFCKEIKRRSKLKNPDREIEIELRNCDIICKIISNNTCDNIFSKTQGFDEEGIINFVQSLCLVSTYELENILSPGTYSLQKLVEVADFNLYRIQIEWVKIWKMISEHLVYAINTYNSEVIWMNALDSLRQTVTKLLQKPDLSVYNFQMDFFKPFELIFIKSINQPKRAELILAYLPTLIQSSNNINSGWIVIFNILKVGLQRKNQKLNDDIMKILQQIYGDFSLFSNINPEVFRGYIECLCHMYLNENLKQFAFDTILNLLTKINNAMNLPVPAISEGTTSNAIFPNEKTFEFLKIFFYGFDDLLRINPIEHINLLFEIISHNKDMIFVSDIKSMLYLHYNYFKPHLCALILFYYENKLSSFDKELEEYALYNPDKNIDNIYFNIRLFLEKSLSNQIKDLENDNDDSEWEYLFTIKHIEEFRVKSLENDKKKLCINFLRNIFKSYEKDDDLIIKKLQILKSFDVKNFEVAIELFFEKLLNMIKSLKCDYMNYNFFYEDLLLTIQSLAIFTTDSSIVFKILESNLTSHNSSSALISKRTWNKISLENTIILNILSTLKKTTTMTTVLNEVVKFNYSFALFYYNLLIKMMPEIEFSINKKDHFKLLNQIMIRYLQIDSDNDLNELSIGKSKEIINTLLIMSRIKEVLLDKDNCNGELLLYSQSTSIIELDYLNKIYKKYSLGDVEGNDVINVIVFELENLVTKFLKFLNRDELEIVFNCLLNFIDCVNGRMRTTAKNLLQLYVSNKQIIFKSYVKAAITEEKNNNNTS